jgi:hypothetical protein
MARHHIRAMTDSALHPLPDWSTLLLTGEDVTTFLNRLLTVNVPEAGSGDSAYGALLSPQGKIQHELFIHAGTDGAYQLQYWTGAREALLKRLNMLKLLAKVAIAQDDRALIMTERPGEGLWSDPREGVTLWRGHGEAAPNAENWNARRIALGLPQQGIDYGFEERWPTDVNMDWLGGVDAKKGCFIGQEVVSRMLRKGGVKRRTMRVEASQPLTKGTLTSESGAPLGELTSMAGSSGLAAIRMDRLGEEPTATHEEGYPIQLTPLRPEPA